MDPKITESAVEFKIQQILNDKTYKGGTEGNLIFYLEGTRKTYSRLIKDLK